MNEKEVAELRRRLRPEKNNIAHIRGCYVNEKREIVSQFNQSLHLAGGEEAEKLLAILKRTLSGALGKNLLDICFETAQVVDSDEHRLLMALRDTALRDEEVLATFYQKAIEAVDLPGEYFILLAHDTYDVPYRAKDGQRLDDAASEVFSYILCSICPVKLTKPALSYHVTDQQFHNQTAQWIVAPPEMGFLFPAFDDRSTNLYNALYYSRDITQIHEAFVSAVFHSAIPMPATEQQEVFQSLLGECLADACSLEVVQAVHSQFCAMVEENKENKEQPPLALTKQTMGQVLAACGVAPPHIEAFEQQYEAAFGADAALNPQNLMEIKQLQVRTPEVTIQVNAEGRHLVTTRVIDGIKYILIRANDEVQVNGIAIQIPASSLGEERAAAPAGV